MASKKQPTPGTKTLRQQIDDKKTNPHKKQSPLEILATKCIDPLDVAEVLKIHPNTLNNWCDEGLLVVSKVKKRSYFDLDDVIKMLDNGKNRLPKT